MLDSGKDLLLRHYMLLLIFFEDIFLLEHLQGIELVVLEMAHQQHLRVGALADHRQDREIF